MYLKMLYVPGRTLFGFLKMFRQDNPVSNVLDNTVCYEHEILLRFSHCFLRNCYIFNRG